jgi:hypothetical protein
MIATGCAALTRGYHLLPFQGEEKSCIGTHFMQDVGYNHPALSDLGSGDLPLKLSITRN